MNKTRQDKTRQDKTRQDKTRQDKLDSIQNYVKIDYAGNMRNQNQGFVGSVYLTTGLCPAVRARDYKDPIMILLIG